VSPEYDKNYSANYMTIRPRKLRNSTFYANKRGTLNIPLFSFAISSLTY